MTVAQRNAVGVTSGESRMTRPDASMPAISRSAGLVPGGTSIPAGRLLPIDPDGGPGWMRARSNSQASRGMTQVMSAGSTACCSSHRQASIPVLPEPTTVKCAGRSVNVTRSFGGITRTPAATAYRGVVIEGTVTFMYVASTTRRRTTTSVLRPLTREWNRSAPSPSGPS